MTLFTLVNLHTSVNLWHCHAYLLATASNLNGCGDLIWGTQGAKHVGVGLGGL